MQICHVHWLGLVPYQQAWDLQAQLADQIAAGEIPATLLLLEHPHTYTFGRRGQPENLLWSDAELQQRSINVYWVDRGGDVTYHGPGQLVGYPLIPLNISGMKKVIPSTADDIPKADYIGYLRNLEQVLILTLQHFGLKPERHENLTGVWIKRSKIAAIGIKVDSRGITRHGFSLNVSPNMNYWDGIIGCGLAGYSVTSMAELLSTPPSMQEVAHVIISSFEKIFNTKCLLVT